MKKWMLLMLLMGMINPLLAEGKTTYTLSGWIDGASLHSTIKIDTSLVKKTNWDEVSLSEVKTTGYFYISKTGEPIFKVTKINIPKKVSNPSLYEDAEEMEETDTNDHYNNDQEYDKVGD